MRQIRQVYDVVVVVVRVSSILPRPSIYTLRGICDGLS